MNSSSTAFRVFVSGISRGEKPWWTRENTWPELIQLFVNRSRHQKGDQDLEQNIISTEWRVAQHVQSTGHVALCPPITSQLWRLKREKPGIFQLWIQIQLHSISFTNMFECWAKLGLHLLEAGSRDTMGTETSEYYMDKLNLFYCVVLFPWITNLLLNKTRFALVTFPA